MATDTTTTISKRGRWCPTIFTVQLLTAAPKSEPRLDEPSFSSDDVQQTDLISFVPQFQSRESFTREEPSYQASLTAGDRIPGPLVAPCLVETSTAHDELLLRVTFSESTILSWLHSSASNLGQSSQTSIPPSPETTGSQQFHPSLYGRRNPSFPLRDKMKLGFLLMGCPNIGPLKLQKPKFKSCDPTHFLQKPRSVLKTFLSTFSPSLYGLSKPIDRRRQLQRQSSVLLWLYKNPLRTLPLDPLRLVCYESKSLKKTDIMLPIPRRRWCDGCHRSFLIYLIPTPLDIESKQSLTSNNCKARIFWGYNEDIDNFKRDLESLPSISKRIPPDYQNVVSIFLADELLWVAPLESTRTSALEPPLTSPSLLTVTNVSSNALFVDEPSTNLAITCANLLHSFCLQALKEPMSNSFIYPFVVTKNVLLSFVFNFEIIVSWYSLNLVLI